MELHECSTTPHRTLRADFPHKALQRCICRLSYCFSAISLNLLNACIFDLCVSTDFLFRLAQPLLTPSPCKWLSHFPSTMGQSDLRLVIHTFLPLRLVCMYSVRRTNRISQVHMLTILYHATASDPDRAAISLPFFVIAVLSSVVLDRVDLYIVAFFGAQYIHFRCGLVYPFP
jgi:hypothetical protein